MYELELTPFMSLLVLYVQATRYSRFGVFLGMICQLAEPSGFSPVWYTISVLMFHVIRVLNFYNRCLYVMKFGSSGLGEKHGKEAINQLNYNRRLYSR